MVKGLNSSHSNVAILSELTELRKKVEILEKKELTLDAQRHTDAKKLVQQGDSTMKAALKLYNVMSIFNSDMSNKFVTLFNDVKQYMDGVFSENQSLRDTNILLIRLLNVTLQNISDSVCVPVKISIWQPIGLMILFRNSTNSHPERMQRLR
ncbi:hypothetical protein L2E82_18415 [Cichorium intybus]|uniref:Uncharacterized protein n=1 Tax=Cichorium intybus TaxID=13427 RepID=A0ACB9FAY2_CICIN|nr:hypothetical protein L2E82_18415 [Cichorium intybus]